MHSHAAHAHCLHLSYLNNCDTYSIVSQESTKALSREREDEESHVGEPGVSKILGFLVL